MRQFWTVAKMLVLAEVFFAISLTSTKYYSDTTIGYELTTKFMDPTDFDKHRQIFFALTAFFAGFLAWLSDGYIGKIFISFLGVFFLLIASIFVTLSAYYEDFIFEKSTEGYYFKAASLLLAIYISTSSIRNVMLLEQVRLPDDAAKVRGYIFCLVMIRVSVMFAYRIITLFKIDQQYLMRLIFPFVTVIIILYFIFLIILTDQMNIEPTFFRIWELCFKCIFVALTRRRAHNKIRKRQISEKGRPTRPNLMVASETYLRFSSQSNLQRFASQTSLRFGSQANLRFTSQLALKESAKEPKATTKKWGFRGIMTDVSHTPMVVPVAESPKIDLFHWLLSYLPFNLDHGTSRESPQADVKEEQSEMDLTDHWVYYAFPIVSIYIAGQAKRMLSLSYVLIPAFLMSNLMYFIIITSIKQEYCIVHSSMEGINQPVDIITYSLIFDFILFPIFEILIYPFLKQCKFLDLHFFGIGYGLLLLGLVLSFFVQIKLETSLLYIPNPNIARMRVFNSLSTTSVVSSTLIGYKRILKGDCYSRSFLVATKYAKFRMRILNEDVRMDKNIIVQLQGGKSISFVIVKNDVKTNSLTHDPSIFTADSRSGVSYFFFVFEFLTSPIQFHFQGQVDSYTYTLSKDSKLEINPGEYTITAIKHGKTESIILNDAVFEESCLYSLFVYFSPKGETLAKLLAMEGPLTLSLQRLLMQVFVSSLANTVSSVSFYRFLYLESPPKLRAASFTLLLAFNLLGLVGINMVIKLEAHYMKYSIIILICGIFHFAFFITTLYFINQYQDFSPTHI